MYGSELDASIADAMGSSDKTTALSDQELETVFKRAFPGVVFGGVDRNGNPEERLTREQMLEKLSQKTADDDGASSASEAQKDSDGEKALDRAQSDLTWSGVTEPSKWHALATSVCESMHN